MEDNWKILASRTLIKDRWINLRADDCMTPSGREVAPYYVLSYPEWVNVVAVTPDRQIVLVRQYRHAVQGWVTELPGGCADPEDHDLATAAVRELLEETGYRVEGEVALVSSLYPNPASSTNRVHTFLARGAVLDRAPDLEAGEEGMSVMLVPADDITSMMQRGEIGQAMHVAGIYQALSHGI